MSKILLIEDRSKRQRLFMEDTGIDLSKYSSIVENAVDEKYNQVYNDLLKESFNFDDYEIIISHKSAYDDDTSAILHRLENYCKMQEKKLILFSGGIDSVYYHKEGRYEHLELNSKLFYSHNLELFLESYIINSFNILSLAYGKQWRLNILIEVLEKTNLYLEQNDREKYFFKKFASQVNINALKNIDAPIELDESSKEISKHEVIIFKEKLSTYIKESVKYE